MYRSRLLAILLLVGAGCRSDVPDHPDEDPTRTGARFLNVRTDMAFVGDAVCASCHEEEYQGYQTHGMAQSFYPLTPENAVEDFTAPALYHAASGFYYRAYQESGRFFQEEYRLSDTGTRTHHLVREMMYVVGSGTAARTYLTEQNGRYFELPVTWYTQVERWDLSPGYAEQNGRFDRIVPDRCMVCHNSYPDPVPFTNGKFTSVPMGIGCERCHGPGDLHVSERLISSEAPDSVDNTIVNPRHLPLALRLDVCEQCHTNGTVSMLREGRSAYAFRPGEPLAAHLSIFSADTTGPGQISVISHARRMQESACFVQTRGTAQPMDCTTCHNPHQGFREEGAAYFNRTCLTCHPADTLPVPSAENPIRPVHEPNADCTFCHMPKVEADDAPHASFTDHRIRVVSTQGGDTATIPSVDAVRLQPYFKTDAEGPQGRLYAGMAYVVYGKRNQDRGALERGVALLVEALDADSSYGEGHFLLGTGRMLLGRVAEAIPALEAALRVNPDVPERLNALAQAYEEEGRSPVVVRRLYRRALQLQPALADVRLNYGRFLESRGEMDTAVTAYRAAVEENAWSAIAHYNLGTALLRQEEHAEAEEQLLEALALQPDYPDALGNLGVLYASQERFEEAESVFARAVDAFPDHAVTLGNLGAFYLNRAEPARAVVLLTRAIVADPAYLDALANLALAHFQLEAYEEARAYAERATAIQPDNALARRILGAL